MILDAENPVVKVCVAGMEAEWAGDIARARELYKEAWAICRDDLEACIAAHYMARHQPKAEERFYWNQTALTCAGRLSTALVKSFYPSLYLNMGNSYEELGNDREAQRYYEWARSCLDDLPDSPYRNWVKYGIASKHLPDDR